MDDEYEKDALKNSNELLSLVAELIDLGYRINDAIHEKVKITNIKKDMFLYHFSRRMVDIAASIIIVLKGKDEKVIEIGTDTLRLKYEPFNDAAILARSVLDGMWGFHAYKKDNSLGIGEPDRWKEECAIIKERISELKAMYGALKKFCDEAGLEMGDILCWNAEIKHTIMLAKGYLETPVAVDETFLDALYRGFRSVWAGTAEEYLDPFTEEELERYGRKVKQGGEGYDAIDIYASSDKVDGAERS